MWNDCSTFSEICDWEENILALNLFVAYYAFLFNKIFKGSKTYCYFQTNSNHSNSLFSCGSWWWFKIWVCLSSRTCEGLLCFTTYSISCYFPFFCVNLVMDGLSSCIEDWCHILALVIVCLLKTWEKFCSHPGQNWWTKQLFVVFHNSCIVQ